MALASFEISSRTFAKSFGNAVNWEAVEKKSEFVRSAVNKVMIYNS